MPDEQAVTISQSRTGRHARPSDDPMPQYAADLPGARPVPAQSSPRPTPGPAFATAGIATDVPVAHLPGPGFRREPALVPAQRPATRAIDIDGPTVAVAAVGGQATRGSIVGEPAARDTFGGPGFEAGAARPQAQPWPSRAERSTQPPSVPIGPTPPVGGAAPRRRRRWPFVVGGIVLLLIVVIVVGSIGAASAPTAAPVVPAPAVPVASVPTVAPVPTAALPTATVPTAEAPTAPTAAAAPSGPATEVGDGRYEVGVDMAAGKYKTAGPGSDSIMKMCYQERARDDSGELGSIISNDIVQGPGVMTVKKGEVVELSGGCTWTKQ